MILTRIPTFTITQTMTHPKILCIKYHFIPHFLSLYSFSTKKKSHLSFNLSIRILFRNFLYQWLHHYTCSGFCKTSYHLLISPLPTNLPNTLKIHTGENRIDRQGRQYTCYFPDNGSTNPDVFQPKTFLIPRGIIPQNFSSLGFAVSEELGNKQTNRQTH